MSGDADLIAPVAQDQPPPAQDAAPPVIEVVKPPEDDALETDAIDAPDGEKYVKLSAVTSARAKAKEARAENEILKIEVGKVAEKDQRIAELQQQLQQIAPIAQAYQAHIEAQRLQPPPPQEPTPQQTAKLQRVAQQLDFYRSDGTLDLVRAQSHLDLLREEAAEIAQAQVAPIQAQTVADKSSLMLQRALITKAPDGSQPDPELVRALWSRVDPNVTATPEGAAQVLSVAFGHSTLLGRMVGKKATAAPIPDPLVIEKAGGREDGPVVLRESDKRVARDMGLTDKQYAEQLKEMPDGWGKGAR